MMRTMGSSSSLSNKGIAAIVGVGPALGRSIARKFAHEGYTVAILARDLGRLSKLAEEIAMEENGQVYAIRIDCSDSRSIREAFEGVLSLGFVEVLVYNANHQPSPAMAAGPSWRLTNFVDIPVSSFETSLAVFAVGAFHCAQQVLPGMVERGRGTILFTGCSASLNGQPGFSELCCGKFALRGLSQCLAREFQPQGVHVAHVILDGAVSAPTTTRVGSTASSTSSLMVRQSLAVDHIRRESDGHALNPDVVAQTYWNLHVQDRSAWTQEIDLRPSPAMATATSTMFSTTARNFF